MPKSYEEISKANANSSGKTDANIANDALHLGGIPAEEYATKKYVQDYHDNKEKALKQYIDAQDVAKLNEAKEYANSLVRNQDFSNFAKDTDIQALDTKLSKKIQDCSTNCANNLKTSIDAVVNDVNSNFTDVNTAITNLNKNQNNLFQSVSDGKKKIAEAITDKGVTTSATASYNTMASNIRSIVTNNIPDGYVYTGDATASESDIKLGKTAYANGNKIYGTSTEVDISQITPTYGTDTTGATATAADIAYGKTAYANGHLLTGTMRNNEVTEIHGLANGQYSASELMGYSNLVDSETDPQIIYKSTGTFGVSLDGRFIVNECLVTKGGQTTRYIQSRQMDSENVYASGTKPSEGNSITYRKSLWTFEELGLIPNVPIGYIAFGNPGFNDDTNDVALCITQGINVHIYRYCIASGAYGYIGYDYGTEKIWHWSTVLQAGGYEWGASCCPTPANLNPNVFGIFGNSQGTGYFFTIKVTSKYSNNVIISNSSNRQPTFFIGGSGDGLKTCKFSVNDNYLYGSFESYLTSDNHTKENGVFGVIKVNLPTYSITTETITRAITVSETESISGTDNSTVLCTQCAISPNEKYIMIGGCTYDLNYDQATFKTSISNQSETHYTTNNARYAGFSLDGQYYYEAYCKTNGGTALYVYETDFSASEAWTPIQIIDLPTRADRLDNLMVSKDMSLILAGNADTLLRISKDYNTQNIVGVTYRGQSFYKPQYLGSNQNTETEEET